MKEYGYVEVEAENEAEAYEKAKEEEENGGFLFNNSECHIGEILWQK